MLRADFDEARGTLVRVYNRLTGDEYAVRGDEFAVDADGSHATAASMRCDGCESRPGSVSARYSGPGGAVEVRYSLKPDHNFLEKRLLVRGRPEGPGVRAGGVEPPLARAGGRRGRPLPVPGLRPHRGTTTRCTRVGTRAPSRPPRSSAAAARGASSPAWRCRSTTPRRRRRGRPDAVVQAERSGGGERGARVGDDVPGRVHERGGRARAPRPGRRRGARRAGGAAAARRVGGDGAG